MNPSNGAGRSPVLGAREAEAERVPDALNKWLQNGSLYVGELHQFSKINCFKNLKGEQLIRTAFIREFKKRLTAATFTHSMSRSRIKKL